MSGYEVLRAANGWFVMPSYSLQNGRMSGDNQRECHVFNDWDECAAWLRLNLSEETVDAP